MMTGIYKHYKGGYYQILGVAAHSETGEEMVVYVSLDATQPGPRMRVRPRYGVNGFQLEGKFEYIGTEIDKFNETY